MPPTMTRLYLLCLMTLEGHHALILRPSRRPLHRQPSSHSAAPRHCYFQEDAHSRHHHTAGSSSSLSSTSSSSDEPPRRVKIRARAATKAVKGGGGAQRSATLTRPKAKRKSKSAAPPSASPEASAVPSNSSPDRPRERRTEKSKAVGDDDDGVEYYRRKPTIHTKSGAPFQHQEMLDHSILTKEEEIVYGRRVVRARELKERIDALLGERRVERELRRMEMEEMDGDLGEAEDDNNGLDYDFLSYELEYLSLYGYRPGEGAGGMGDGADGGPMGGFDLEDDLLIDHAQHRSRHMSQLYGDASVQNFSGAVTTGGGPRRDGYRNGSSSLRSSSSSPPPPPVGGVPVRGTAARNSYTPLLNIPLHRLSESDAIDILDVKGGKVEVVDILLEGARARETLMRRNVKLVMSVAKNWMRNSFSTAGANISPGNGVSSSSYGKGNNKRGDKSRRQYLAQMYEGSWDRPSLDEAAQEGMLGLARAVDKYDPERGLRFSTYATHWITSYVRTCFQRAVTGCLRVPSQLHDIKAAYNRILKDHLHLGASPPGQESIAKELGISEKRLRTAIRATGSLLSVDAPVIGGNGGNYKGSMAGGDGANGQELLILDTLKCAEPRPEDQVEISFLRQCLENAMATELTPHERDVLRLRLGLDSGEGKTVRAIVEMSGGSMSMSDVRGTEKRAFKKLRSPASVHAHNLLAYLDFVER